MVPLRIHPVYGDHRRRYACHLPISCRRRHRPRCISDLGRPARNGCLCYKLRSERRDLHQPRVHRDLFRLDGCDEDCRGWRGADDLQPNRSEHRAVADAGGAKHEPAAQQPDRRWGRRRDHAATGFQRNGGRRSLRCNDLHAGHDLHGLRGLSHAGRLRNWRNGHGRHRLLLEQLCETQSSVDRKRVDHDVLHRHLRAWLIHHHCGQLDPVCGQIHAGGCSKCDGCGQHQRRGLPGRQRKHGCHKHSDRLDMQRPGRGGACGNQLHPHNDSNGHPSCGRCHLDSDRPPSRHCDLRRHHTRRRPRSRRHDQRLVQYGRRHPLHGVRAPADW
ncbi:hypothetical protein D3C85_994360 [compost metagenome]